MIDDYLHAHKKWNNRRNETQLLSKLPADIYPTSTVLRVTMNIEAVHSCFSNSPILSIIAWNRENR